MAKGVFERGDTGIYSAYIAALLIMVGGVLLKVFDKPRMGLSVLLIALGLPSGAGSTDSWLKFRMRNSHTCFSPFSYVMTYSIVIFIISFLIFDFLSDTLNGLMAEDRH
uniref:hypothetical protein n=1 Tax=Serratia proteamaculans TaxID=28151 RepID=UPI001F4C17C9|nr:hypothetical protein [Serratia proteamaculans]ULG14320.1 hypothetical protein 28Fp_00033 [Serratia proteamaculans]